MTPNAQPKPAPHRIAYFFALLPFLAGCIICSLLIVRMVRTLAASTDAFPRVIVPGVATVTLDKPGAYTIFLETKSVIGNKAYVASEEALSGILCSLEDVETGHEVALAPSTANMNYSFGSHEGTSIFEFAIETPGSYRLEAQFPEGGHEGQRFVLAIGQGFMKDIFQSIGLVFAIVGLLIITIAGSTAGIVIIYLRRSRAQQKI